MSYLFSNKKLITILLAAGVFAISSFFLANNLRQLLSSQGSTDSAINENNNSTTENKVIAVKTRPASAFSTLTENLNLPAIVVLEKESDVIAKTNGIAKEVNFKIGEKIRTGNLLAKIDDAGTGTPIGLNGIASNGLVQAGIAVTQSQESISLAEETLYNLEKSSKDDLDGLKLTRKQAKKADNKDQVKLLDEQISSAKRKFDTQLETAKTQLSLSQLQYQNALLTLESAKDSHLVTAPTDGTITQKLISSGESVNTGQILAKIGSTSNQKVQFYVNEEQKNSLFINQPVKILNQNQEQSSGKISAISPEADSQTKRFLIEAKSGGILPFAAESLVSVSLEIKKVAAGGTYFLPISAVTIGQNENFIFILQAGKAQKLPVSIKKIQGENAEVETDLANNGEIITEGNKLVVDGGEVTTDLVE